LYHVEFCYLFGSYAKGKATEKSDVDLLVSTETTGLTFFEMTERLRESLHKKVDLLDLKQLINNENLLREVLKEGIKIYG
jgi:predicted nucleotidyltransferase